MHLAGVARLLHLFLLTGLIIGLLTACDPGIEDHLKQRTVAAEGERQRSQVALVQARKEFDGLSSGADAAFLKKYIAAEKLSERFTEAGAEFSDAEKLLSQAQGIAKANKAEGGPRLQTLLNEVSSHLLIARSVAESTAERLSTLLDARNNTSRLVKEAQDHARSAAAISAGLSRDLTALQKKYPQRQDLQAQLQRFSAASDKIAGQARIVQTQAKAHSPDYGLLSNAHIASGDLLVSLQTDETALRTRLAELGQSQVKTLVDMQVKYACQIGRSSWDESSDFDNENEYLYPAREVGADAYESLDLLDPEANVAESSYGSVRPMIAAGLWDPLGIDPGENMPGGDDSAVFYIADLPLHFYHKYALNQNGKVSQSDWVEVDAKTFADHEGDLGMDIETKPYGYFKAEAISTATPPGMAYVGNPAYGSWSGSGAARTWIFLPIYRSYPVYSYAAYSDWSQHYRGRQAYYGPKDRKGEYAYGSGGSYASRFYSGSHYARSGGYGDLSARGAGPGRRGGGPGGGGK
ncbi:MAG TPA: hypothetical protein V6D23_07895 [Candidatus Obscuribacterales bacterium]